MAQRDKSDRLEETRILAGMLADRMMAAYVVGGRPSDDQIRALCAAVLLLEDHGLPLPAYADTVIAKLLAEDPVSAAAPNATIRTIERRRPGGAFGAMLRPLRLRRAA